MEGDELFDDGDDATHSNGGRSGGVPVQDPAKSVFLSILVVIADRGRGEQLLALAVEDGVPFSLLTRGRGTADTKLLCYLGLGEPEKDILYSLVHAGASRSILEKLNARLLPKEEYRGIAFAMPITAMADTLPDKPLQESTWEPEMPTEQPYDLIVAVTNQGYADEVMDVARAAGARGGTVLPARSISPEKVREFFGVSIHPEKEMLFILAKREARPRIMAAIADKKGLQTDAQTVVFSLPVSGVAGLPPEA